MIANDYYRLLIRVLLTSLDGMRPNPLGRSPPPQRRHEWSARAEVPRDTDRWYMLQMAFALPWNTQSHGIFEV